MIQLPTQKIISTVKNPNFLVLYGPPKCGKTSSLAELDNNLILDIEKGSRYVDALKIQAESWEEVYEIGEEILKQGRPYKYISLDTATKLEEWAEELGKRLYLSAPMAAKKYKENPELLASILVLPGEKGSYGPGYLWLRIAYLKCLDYLLTLADTIILVAHIKDVAMVDKESKEITSTDLALTGKLKQITCGRADAIGYMYRVTAGAKDGKPISQLRVSFYSGTDVLASTRCKHLAGQDFEFDWKRIFIEE